MDKAFRYIKSIIMTDPVQRMELNYSRRSGKSFVNELAGQAENLRRLAVNLKAALNSAAIDAGIFPDDQDMEPVECLGNRDKIISFVCESLLQDRDYIALSSYAAPMPVANITTGQEIPMAEIKQFNFKLEKYLYWINRIEYFSRGTIKRDVIVSLFKGMVCDAWLAPSITEQYLDEAAGDIFATDFGDVKLNPEDWKEATTASNEPTEMDTKDVEKMKELFFGKNEAEPAVLFSGNPTSTTRMIVDDPLMRFTEDGFEEVEDKKVERVKMFKKKGKKSDKDRAIDL